MSIEAGLTKREAVDGQDVLGRMINAVLQYKASDFQKQWWTAETASNADNPIVPQPSKTGGRGSTSVQWKPNGSYWDDFWPNDDNSTIIAAVEALGSYFGTQQFYSDGKSFPEGQDFNVDYIAELAEKTEFPAWNAYGMQLVRGVFEKSKLVDKTYDNRTGEFHTVDVSQSRPLGHLRLLLYKILTSPGADGKCLQQVTIGGETFDNPYYEACRYGRDDSLRDDQACGWDRKTGKVNTNGNNCRINALNANDPLAVPSWDEMVRPEAENFPCQATFKFPTGYSRTSRSSKGNNVKTFDVKVVMSEVPNPNYDACLAQYDKTVGQPVIPGDAPLQDVTGTSIGCFAPQGYQLPEDIKNAGTAYPTTAGRHCSFNDVWNGEPGCRKPGDKMPLSATSRTAAYCVKQVQTGNWVNYTVPQDSNDGKPQCVYDLNTGGSGPFSSIPECEKYQAETLKTPAYVVFIAVAVVSSIVAYFISRDTSFGWKAWAVAAALTVIISGIYAFVQRQ